MAKVVYLVDEPGHQITAQITDRGFLWIVEDRDDNNDREIWIDLAGLKLLRDFLKEPTNER